eukprot:2809866-Rhodomonas_salina.4
MYPVGCQSSVRCKSKGALTFDSISAPLCQYWTSVSDTSSARSVPWTRSLCPYRTSRSICGVCTGRQHVARVIRRKRAAVRVVLVTFVSPRHRVANAWDRDERVLRQYRTWPVEAISRYLIPPSRCRRGLVGPYTM